MVPQNKADRTDYLKIIVHICAQIFEKII